LEWRKYIFLIVDENGAWGTIWNEESYINFTGKHKKEESNLNSKSALNCCCFKVGTGASKKFYNQKEKIESGTHRRLIRLAYNPYFFGQRTVFFSHNKSVNSTFSHGLSAKRTGHR